MNTKMKLALAFATLAGMTGAASAVDNPEPAGDADRKPAIVRFDKADADESGAVSLEEFIAAVGDRFSAVDADANGSVTLEELTASIERAREQRFAQRMMDRLDVDKDSKLSKVEFEAARERKFARLDQNKDGMILPDEMQKHGKGEKARKK